MAKTKYSYNSETCRYEPVVTSTKTFFKRSSVFVALAVGIALAALFFFNLKFPQWDEARLRADNEALKSEWQSLYHDLHEVSSELQKLEQNDDQNYRAILDLNPLSPEERKAGVGGREKAVPVAYPLIQKAYEQTEKTLARLDIEIQSYDQLISELERKEKMWASRPAIQPIDNKDLTFLHTTYGMRFHPILGYVRPHKGLDFTAPKGSPVYATGDGEVVNAEYSGTYGNVVYINHGFSFETRYAHLLRFIVRNGEKVKRGQIIGYVGNTGLSKSTHLHYEVLYNGIQINPINFFQRDLSNEEYERLIELGSESITSLD